MDAARPWVGCFRFHGWLAAAAPACGRPVVVLRQGVVRDASRSARTAGVRPGQSAAAARALCPEAVRCEVEALPPEVLRPAWDLVARIASVVEPDPGGAPEVLAAWPAGAPPVELIRALQEELVGRPAVDLAVGVATTRLLARACCPAPRPGVPSVRLVPAGAEADWLGALPLGRLATLGEVPWPLVRALEARGAARCGQVLAVGREALRARLGRDGLRVYALCCGCDGQPVRALYPPRAVVRRSRYPDTLPPEAWADAAGALARGAAAELWPREGAGRLVLRGPFGERVRTWSLRVCSPPSLARAAAGLAARAAAEARGTPCSWLEVALEDLAVAPVRAVSLWDASRGRLVTARLEELLARLPSPLLRRGWGGGDRHERLRALLDPWYAVGGGERYPPPPTGARDAQPASLR